nr:hypothetical protein Iba_chr08cCG5980 [Ipomoea batatas]
MFPLSPRIPDCFANIRRPIRIPIHKQLPTRVRDKEIRAGPIGRRRPDGTTPPCGPTSIAAPPGTRSRPTDAAALPSAPAQPAALVDRQRAVVVEQTELGEVDCVERKRCSPIRTTRALVKESIGVIGV